MVTVSADHTVRVWNAFTAQPVTEPLRHNEAVVSAQFSSYGLLLLTACRSGNLYLWRVGNANPVRTLSLRWEIASASLSEDGKRIAMIRTDQTVLVVDADTGVPLN